MRAVDVGDPGLVLKLLLEPIVLDSELPDDFLIEFDVAAQILFFSSELGDFSVAVSNSPPPWFFMAAGGGEQFVNHWAVVAGERRTADAPAGRQRRWGRGGVIPKRAGSAVAVGGGLLAAACLRRCAMAVRTSASAGKASRPLTPSPRERGRPHRGRGGPGRA